jgi:cytochrome c-type biogenesis protein CcmH
MRKLAWGALVVVVLGALVVGVRDRSPATADERAHRLGDSIMCPACSGESVTGSQAPVAVAIRGQIADMIEQGKSDAEIRDTLVGSYGNRIVLNPPRSGLAGLVWVLPVAALVVALAGLVLVFRRWRTTADEPVTPDDVEAAARARQAGGA